MGIPVDLLSFGGPLRRFLIAAVLTVAVAGISACAQTPPPVSQKVQDYYDKDVLNASPKSVTPAVKLPVAAFLGDSYTQGEGASTPAKSWVSLLSAGMKWQMKNLGRGGTGYVTASDVNGCGLDVCPDYEDMANQAIAAKPSVVVVAGGQNDYTAFTDNPEDVTRAVNATFSKLRKALPKAQIVAVGPSSPWGVTEDMVAMDRVVRDAAASVKAKYVNLLEPSVITADMVLEDRAHVNDAGHKAIAERVMSALR